MIEHRKRGILRIELRTDKIYRKLPQEYKYASAHLYETGIDNLSASSGGIAFSSSRFKIGIGRRYFACSLHPQCCSVPP